MEQYKKAYADLQTGIKSGEIKPLATKGGKVEKYPTIKTDDNNAIENYDAAVLSSVLIVGYFSTLPPLVASGLISPDLIPVCKSA
jgi:hypothetical protein